MARELCYLAYSLPWRSQSLLRLYQLIQLIAMLSSNKISFGGGLLSRLTLLNWLYTTLDGWKLQPMQGLSHRITVIISLLETQRNNNVLFLQSRDIKNDACHFYGLCRFVFFFWDNIMIYLLFHTGWCL